MVVLILVRGCIQRSLYRQVKRSGSLRITRVHSYTQQIFRHNLCIIKGRSSLTVHYLGILHVRYIFYRRCSLPTRRMPQQTIIVSLKSSYQFFHLLFNHLPNRREKKTSAVILRNRRFTGITYQIRKSGSVMNHSINSTPI